MVVSENVKDLEDNLKYKVTTGNVSKRENEKKIMLLNSKHIKPTINHYLSSGYRFHIRIDS